MEANHIEQKDFQHIFAQEVKKINKVLPKFSQITSFKLRDAEFEKTPKRSIKRFLYQK